MILDIIVPHYNEPWEVVRPFVDMIHAQKGVNFSDFRVMIVHDGVDPFPDEFLEGPANIVQVSIPKSGVSAARNYGIDHSEAKWVNFSDCDDCFCSIFSLYMIFPVLRENEQFDLLWSPFYMIRKDMLKVFSEYNSIFIHNKYYRRSFLNEKDIRFCERLYMSEDSAFNAIVTARIGSGRLGSINVKDPVFAWCRRDGSVTLDPSRWLKNIEGHFERNLYMLEECQKREDFAAAKLMVGRTLTDVYAQLMRPREIDADASGIQRKAAEFFWENQEIFYGIPDDVMDRLLGVSDLEAGTDETTKKTRPGIADWLEKLVDEFEVGMCS